MNEIRALLRLAARRLEWSMFFAALNGAAIVLAAGALALVIADRLPAESFVPWAAVVPALAAVGVLWGVVRWWRRRIGEVAVAVAVDQRLGLKERLSTALHCRDRDDPFAQAAVEDAVTTARDPRAREAVRRRFAVAAPPRWWLSPVLVTAALLVGAAPQADLLAPEEPSAAVEIDRVRTEVRESLDLLVSEVEEKPQLSRELADLVDELAVDAEPNGNVDDPEQLKRNALKKVTELNKRLDEIVNGERGDTMRAIEKMLGQIEASEDGPAGALAKALAEGDFAKARQALEDLVEAAQNGAMDAEAKAALADQLEKLGAELEKLARQQQQLERALEQAGLNPQLANNPEALRQALEQAKNLNQQQRQQLQQMMQAQQAAQQMCQGLGGACQQLAQQIAQGQGAGAAQQMGEQLNDLEQLQMLLQQAQAMANKQGEGQGVGQGMNMDQAMQQWMQGGGMGKRGRGSGGKAPIARTPTGTRLIKADAPIVDGEIIASMLVDGTPIRGESKARLREVVARGAEGYDEAVNEDPLPRRYHDTQKHYFGEMQAQVEAILANVDAKTPPEGPDGDAPDADAPEGDAPEGD